MTIIVIATQSEAKGKQSAFKFEIVNIIGQVVYSSVINRRSSVIDLSNFQSGIYLVKLYSEQGLILKKIVKE
ncbi:MAG: T9SS type A sorting domain-containing protein [Bacteroidia bacterium]|nr:T9SS type A sorting domain-containing protein [Bacteroidia bacterium]